jgi:hypothetical protein
MESCARVGSNERSHNLTESPLQLPNSPKKRKSPKGSSHKIERDDQSSYFLPRRLLCLEVIKVISDTALEVSAGNDENRTKLCQGLLHIAQACDDSLLCEKLG